MSKNFNIQKRLYGSAKSLFVIFVCMLTAMQFLFINFAFASATDGTIDATDKWAWSENIGWINFGNANGNVHITDSGMTGYAWSSYYGWINLAPTNGGVSIDNNGNLSGYAWGSNTGWINFSGVSIDDSGYFQGFANGTITGQINFNCANNGTCASSDYKVRTDYRYYCARNSCGGGPPPIFYECNDNFDNDGDGLTDYPDDPGCSSFSDNDESDDPEEPATACSDGEDNDGDGLIDMEDPGCENAEDDDEYNEEILPECSDGEDNDEDGLIDMEDPGCENAEDDDEYNEEILPECSDGEDNDGDGFIDMEDFGCDNPEDDDEYNEEILPECSNNLDDDGDGLIDMEDPGCADADDNDEYNQAEEEEEPEEKPEVPDEPEEPGDDDDSTPSSGGDEEEEEEPEEDEEEPQELEEEEEPEQVEEKSEDATIIKEIKEQEKKEEPQLIRNIIDTVKIAEVRQVVEQATEEAAAPVAVAFSAVTVASTLSVTSAGASGASFFSYLYFLFTQPLILVGAKKRRWGLVYNAVTKKPVDLAIVRVYDAESKRLVGTRVTDKQGRYNYILKPGKYYFQVEKNNFLFPTVLLKGKTKDQDMDQLYTGGVFEVEGKGNVAMQIPVDPDIKDEKDKNLLRRNLVKRLQFVISLVGPIISLIAFIISPTWLLAGLTVGQLAMFFLFRYLAYGRQYKNWATIKAVDSKEPLSQAIVRVFDTKFNKLLDRRVTDSKGRYSFLVGDGEYYITVEKSGYRPYRSEVFDMSKNKTGYLAKNIKLKKHKLGEKYDDALLEGKTYTVRTELGRQEEKQVDGKRKVIRKEDEKFKRELKDVDLNEMHEDYYDLDVLRDHKKNVDK